MAADMAEVCLKKLQEEDGGNSQYSQTSSQSLTQVGTPLRKELVNGSNWTEQDLNNFGIKYSLTASEPCQIFEMIKPHIPPYIGKVGIFHSDDCRNLEEQWIDQSLRELKKHTTMLQESFSKIFVLNADCLKLLRMVELGQQIQKRVQRYSDRPRPTDDYDDIDDDVDADRVVIVDDNDEELNRQKWSAIGNEIFTQIAKAKSELDSKRPRHCSNLQLINNWIPTFINIESFLNTLNSVLESSAPTNLEVNEGTFVDLFQDFARIFFVQFKPAMVKRSFKMGGMKVLSINNLRYDSSDHVFRDDQPKIVVTVAEVKKAAKKKEPYVGRKRRMSKVQKMDRRADVGGATGHDDPDDNDDESDGDGDSIEFSSKLRGQVGIELLADIERSCLKQVDNKRMILGLTVEATLVRLICLQMDMDELKEMQDKPPKDNPSHVGTIHYTKAYDMLQKDDRLVLISIMRYLLFLSNDPVVKHLPGLV